MMKDPSGLSGAFDAPESKHRYVRRLFATIADRYDLITVLLSFGRDRHWKRRLVALAGIGPGSRVLDLACGTGDIAFEAASHGAAVTGLDLTPRMIELAKGKAGHAVFLVGDMMALPFGAARFDVVTTGYGLRNVPDLPGALAEIFRVLAPGGTLCSLDFDRPEPRLIRAIYLGYLTVVGSGLGWILHRDPDTYRYIPESIRRYAGSRGVADLMRGLGFVNIRSLPVFGGFMAIHVARRD
jgi:demethylmenaquinone methyltransferase/2-methoxy-6-polyprenyl-1,4-benzoquinol methylase